MRQFNFSHRANASFVPMFDRYRCGNYDGDNDETCENYDPEEDLRMMFDDEDYDEIHES